jgi:OOP family OmpA-OmpF porin
MVADADLRVEVDGHTDSIGTEEYNMLLSLRRAEAVRDYLVENYPELTESMFVVRDFGKSQPIADNSTAEGRSQNRRVELKIMN